MANDVRQFNKQVIQQHEVASNEKKKKDLDYAHTLELSDSRMQEDLQQAFQKDKQRASQYRSELFQQVQEEKERRTVEKQREKEGNPIVPMIEISKPYDQIQYRTELKNQIDQKAQQNAQEKSKKVEEEQAMLKFYQD